MPTERAGSDGLVAGLAVLGVVACCSLPVLLSAAVGLTIAGVALGVWVVVLAGVAVGLFALSRLRAARCGRNSAADSVSEGDSRAEVGARDPR